MRLIDADDYCKTCGCEPPYGNNGVCVGCCICDCPTIEAEPVIHAHWIPKYVSNGMTDLFECSNCSAQARVEFMSDRCYFKRCHNCGARMDGGVENGVD